MSAPAASLPQPALSHSLPRRFWPWLAAASTGVLLILCFPPWNQGWLCWIALTPLLSALFAAPPGGKRRGLRLAALGYVAGWLFIVGSFWWIGGSLAPLFGNRLLFTLTPLIALYMGLYVAFWGWFVAVVLAPDDGTGKRFQSSARNLFIGCAGAGAWVVTEYSRTWLFGGFGWNPLGVALHQDLPMIQIVDITGVPGLSFLIVFVNLMAVIVVRRLISELGPAFLTRVRWEFSVTIALVALVFAYGVHALLRHPATAGPPTVPLRVVAIQPNIPQSEKEDLAMEQAIFENLDRLTGLAALSQPHPQLFIWPEASTPRSMFADQVNYRFVIDQAKRAGSALLIGTLDFDPERREDYNIAALLTDKGETQQFYRKIHLVPFGEYLPLRPVFSAFVGQLVPSDFTPGTEYTVLELSDPPIRFAALICFEDSLGDLTRRFVGRGAELLVNITNDGWFGRTPGASQHLANALFRAVENRRPLIRCGNTGVTCSVDINGRVDLWIDPFVEGFSAREIPVPTTSDLTFYTRYGDWVTWLSAGIALLAVAGSIRRRVRRDGSFGSGRFTFDARANPR
jgi:apolipoprotein N-acyltransferase